MQRKNKQIPTILNTGDHSAPQGVQIAALILFLFTIVFKVVFVGVFVVIFVFVVLLLLLFSSWLLFLLFSVAGAACKAGCLTSWPVEPK